MTSIRLLRGAGHDVAAVIEEAGADPDTAILTRAVVEGRVLLTFDRDYGDLVYGRRLPAPPGIVYFRLGNPAPEEAGERLLQRLADPGFVLDGWFTVIERGPLRQRPLP